MIKWFACLSCFTKFSDVIDDDCPHCGSDDTFEVVSNASMRRAFEFKKAKTKTEIVKQLAEQQGWDIYQLKM